MSYTRQAVSARLLRIRKHFELQQQEIAELAGLSPSTWSEIEAGKRDISKPAAMRLCDAIDNLTLDYIYRGKLTPPLSQILSRKLGRTA